MRGLIFYLKKVVSIVQLGRIKNPTTLLNSHHSTLCKACKYFDFSRNMKLKKFVKSKFPHPQINTPTFYGSFILNLFLPLKIDIIVKRFTTMWLTFAHLVSICLCVFCFIFFWGNGKKFTQCKFSFDNWLYAHPTKYNY